MGGATILSVVAYGLSLNLCVAALRAVGSGSGVDVGQPAWAFLMAFILQKLHQPVLNMKTRAPIPTTTQHHHLLCSIGS